MPIDVNQQLRHLPFKIVQELKYCLEFPSNKDWLALIRVMPEDRFTQKQVAMMKHDGERPNNSYTEVLWRELGHLCITVKELGYYLKKIENYDALFALDWPHEPVEITSQPDSKVLPEGENLRLRVTAIGFPLPTFQWYKNGEVLRGEETCELTITGVAPSDSGKYKCVVSNKATTCTSSEAKVQVMAKVLQPVNTTPEENTKPVIITHPRSQHVLPGNHCMLHCEALGKEPLKYTWYKDGHALINSDRPELELRLFGENDIGRYSCEVANAHGNDISDVAELTIGQIGREFRNEATDKVALLVGNQDYSANFSLGFQGQGMLKHTINDTKTLGSLLNSEDMGFHVLSFANLSRMEMQRAIEEFLGLLSEDCYIVFYYAGHGFELNGKHYMVPTDAPANWLQEDCICIQQLLEAVWKARPKLTTVLLDMCRIRPADTSRATFEEYDFPIDLKIVMGFATCSQSESYEIVDEDNGIYMKHLKNHICRDVKIEDILHDVNTEVEAETTRCRFTEHQRPEYITKGGGYFSLRDPTRPRGNTSAERWLEAHKLPRRRILEFEHGVKVEVRFEHCNWLTNTINIFVRILDQGNTDHSYAYVHQLPNAGQQHFSQGNQNGVSEEPAVDKIASINARSWPRQQPTQPVPAIIESERSTKMNHLQRLYGNLPVTIALVSELAGSRSREYKVTVFSANEFGLAQVFGGLH